MGRAALVALFVLAASGAFAQEAGIEATTASGEKVRLFPNGRWEYADPAKAEPQRKAQEAQEQRERGAQGTLLPFGRRIYEGDKDYNRGSLNPSKRY